MPSLYNILTERPDESGRTVDPVVTSLVSGTPQRTDFPSMRLLPSIGVDSKTFEYRTFGVDHMKIYDTERDMRAEIESADFTHDKATGKLRRFTLKSLADADELANAEPSLRLRERKAGLAERLVKMDLEKRMADFLVDSGNYASTTAIAGGSEWDAAGGDSRADIGVAVAAIEAATGISRQNLTVYLSEASRNAAMEDPTFLAIRDAYTTDRGGLDTLRNYWDVGEVWSSGGNYAADDGTLTSLYGDVAIVYYAGGQENFDLEYGNTLAAAQFVPSARNPLRTGALEAWYDDNTTSWNFAWQDWVNWYVINSAAWYLITNTAA